MIEFKECNTPGYKARTLENIRDSSVTIAIASDYYTAGERCTRNGCIEYNKPYIQLPLTTFKINIQPSHYNVDMDESTINSVVQRLLAIQEKKPWMVINIAGNGIYSLDYNQNIIDTCLFALLVRLNKDIVFHVRSGGQTGIDEGALNAAKRSGIPALCLAPKGWVFRDRNGKDIADEKLFKDRFK